MKTLLELEEGECRFTADEQDFRFCAKPTHFYMLNGKLCQSPWCREHYLICVQPLKENKRQAA